MPTAVPYSGTIDVSPSLSPTPYRQVNAPLGAFGGGVAAATEHLGQVSESAAGEVFSRAAAMQEMKENADAQAKMSQYTQSIAEQQADYLTKQGKDAVDGLPGYLSNIEKTRTEIGGTLNSPYAQQIYNEQTRFMSGRLSISAADHSAQQNKAYSTATRAAVMESTTNLSMADPRNYDQVFAGGEAIRKAANDEAIQGGFDPNNPAHKLIVDKTVSQYYSKWLTSLAKTEPWEAGKQLDRVRQSGGIIGEDIGKVQDAITQQQHTVGARKIGETVTSGADGAYGRTGVTLDRAKDAIGGYESANNYNSRGPVVTSGPYAGQRGAGRYMIMPGNLPQWLSQADMPAMTVDQFINDHDAQDELFEKRFGADMQTYGSFNKAANVWFTGSPNPNPKTSDGYHTAADYISGTNARLAKSASLDQLQAHGAELSQALAPGDSDQAYFTAKQIEQQHGVQLASTRDTTFQSQQTIDGAMLDGYISGKPPSISQIQNDPNTAQAWANLNNGDKLKYAEKLAAMANAPKIVTPEMKQQYNQLKGMSVNAPDEFLKQDPLSMNLPWSMQKEFIDDKASVYKQAQTDPNIATALRVLGPQLDTAGLTKEKDAKGLNQFTGELMGILKDETVNAARPLKQDEIRAIGTRLLQDNAQANIFHGGSRVPSIMRDFSAHASSPVPVWKVDVPAGAAAIIRNDPGWAAKGITPTDEAIQEIYTKTLYNQLAHPEPIVRSGIGSK